MLLAALAAGAGLVRAGLGIANAGKNARRDRDLIKRAYQRTKNRTNLQQGDIRQSTTESLNARGILNGGDNVIDSQAVAAAKAGAPAPGKGIMGAIKGRAAAQAQSEENRMAADATRGQTGQGNTLSGGIQSDLSREFLLEHQDLFAQREAAIEGTKRQQQADVAGAIASGIDVGTSVYSAGSMLKGAYGAKAGVPSTPPIGTPSPIGPGGWFGGYDPVDPLGMKKKSLSTFNVKD